MSQRQKNLLFIIDATASMKSELKSVRRKMNEIKTSWEKQIRGCKFRYACICYRDSVDVESEPYHFLPLVDDFEWINSFLKTIEPFGGGDGPEDYVGALQIARRILKYSAGDIAIFWFADAPAHGEKFCNLENHQDEEEKLESITREIANKKISFYGYSIEKGADLSFQRMKEIYTEAGNQCFYWFPFSSN